MSLRSKLLAIGTALPLLAVAQPATNGGPPTAQVILAKYVEVTGGQAAYLRIHSMITTGTAEVVGVKAKFTFWSTEPNKTFQQMDVEGVGMMQQGVNGKVDWDLSRAGPSLKTGGERAYDLATARLHWLLNWRDIFRNVKTNGEEMAEGEVCYKIIATPLEGDPIFLYFSKDSGLLVKTEHRESSPGIGDVLLKEVFSDYRKEGDLVVAHQITEAALNVGLKMSVESVKYNPVIAAKQFDLPDEIKALLDKK